MFAGIDTGFAPSRELGAWSASERTIWLLDMVRRAKRGSVPTGRDVRPASIDETGHLLSRIALPEAKQQVVR